MASVGHMPLKRASPVQLSDTAPSTISAIPSAMRLSKFSLNANQASSAVNTPSAFSNSEAPDAAIPLSPNISSTGPTMPPEAMAPANQISSLRGRRAPDALIANRYTVSPRPEPR